jgi:hypothetical protein
MTGLGLKSRSSLEGLLNELNNIAFANIGKIVRPERRAQAVLDWSTGRGMPMGRDVDAGLAGLAVMRWVQRLIPSNAVVYASGPP